MEFNKIWVFLLGGLIVLVAAVCGVNLHRLAKEGSGWKRKAAALGILFLGIFGVPSCSTCYLTPQPTCYKFASPQTQDFKMKSLARMLEDLTCLERSWQRGYITPKTFEVSLRHNEEDFNRLVPNQDAIKKMSSKDQETIRLIQEKLSKLNDELAKTSSNVPKAGD